MSIFGLPLHGNVLLNIAQCSKLKNTGIKPTQLPKRTLLWLTGGIVFARRAGWPIWRTGTKKHLRALPGLEKWWQLCSEGLGSQIPAPWAQAQPQPGAALDVRTALRLLPWMKEGLVYGTRTPGLPSSQPAQQCAFCPSPNLWRLSLHDLLPGCAVSTLILCQPSSALPSKRNIWNVDLIYLSPA